MMVWNWEVGMRNAERKEEDRGHGVGTGCQVSGVRGKVSVDRRLESKGREHGA
jgi:hypothetical protein